MNTGSTYPESNGTKIFTGARLEIPQRTRIFKVNCCLKVHNAPLKVFSPILGKAALIETIDSIQNGAASLIWSDSIVFTENRVTSTNNIHAGT